MLEAAEEVEVRGPPLFGELDPDELEWAEASDVVLLRRVLSGGRSEVGVRAERWDELFGVVGRLADRKGGDGATRKAGEVLGSNLDDGEWLRSSLWGCGWASSFGARLCLERSWVEPRVEARVGKCGRSGRREGLAGGAEVGGGKGGSLRIRGGSGSKGMLKERRETRV